MDDRTARPDDQVEDIVKGARLRLANAKERAHILSAVLRSADQYDAVVAVFRSSESPEAGRQRVAEMLDLDEVQIRAVTGITVGMPSQAHYRQMVAEYDELLARITDLEAVLASPDRQHDLISTERGNDLGRYGAE